MTTPSIASPDSNDNRITKLSRVEYSIATIGDAVIVLDRNGNAVDEYDLWMVDDLLREAKRQVRRVSEDHAARSLNWVFPTKRSEWFGINQCVYAIMPTSSDHTTKLPPELQSSWPNVIKVGYTGVSLSSRRSHLEGQLGGDLTVYAYAECNHPSRAEAGLHRSLSPAHVFREWFERDYVMGYIEGGMS